jgi:16S rRNA (guanine527-N7)-methyltransferase
MQRDASATPAEELAGPQAAVAGSALAGSAVTAVPPPPPEAREIFGSVLPLAEQYAQLLVGPGVERGLLGPAEAARVWDRHLLNCAVVAELVPVPCSLVDLGSGAGLPGIVMAMLLPDAEVTLLEPMARRASFLEECVDALGLANAVVRRGRAEDMAGQIAADVVIARAVAPMDRLASMAAGLARPGGMVLAIKGAGAADEVMRAQSVLRQLGVQDLELVLAGDGKVDPAATVVRFTTGLARNRGGTRFKPGAGGYHPGGAGKARGGSAGHGPNSRKGRPNGRRSGG